MQLAACLLILTLLTSLPSIAEEEQKKPKKQPELTPVLRAMFSSPRNRDVRVHDGWSYYGHPAADNGNPCPNRRAC